MPGCSCACSLEPSSRWRSSALWRAAFGDLGNPGEFQPDRWPALGEALEIAVGQLPLGAGFHPAHGMN